MFRTKAFSAIFGAAALLASPLLCFAQELNPVSYSIGAPILTELWVDGAHGSDQNNGLSRASALQSVTAAWGKIPIAAQLQNTGYRINVTSGVYSREQLPNYWESRWGSRNFPIIIQAADGRGSATFAGDMNVFDVRYLYVIDLNIIPTPAGDAFHCEQCDHILLRSLAISGGAREAHETVKVNQSQYIYLEDNDIQGADDNAVDFVAVQYGHVLRNRIHNAQDWCMYVKGGSAYLTIAGNEIYDCGTGGFTAGQGTGFEFMTAPWLHYEAYDIKAINNVIHDTEGAGLGVNGGYNILAAFNTLYKVGSRSHVIEVVFGSRSCDGNAAACSARRAAGGWGPASPSSPEVAIPNRNVYIFNNLVYNPLPYRSGYQQFAIYGPQVTAGGSNVPSPARADTNLQIKGNIIFNGPGQNSLGVEDSDQGCQAGNPTCSAAQLVGENAINTIEPQLINAGAEDFRPVEGGNIFNAAQFSAPQFPGGDREAVPLAAAGNLANDVSTDRGASARNPSAVVPGAYSSSTSDLNPGSNYPPILNPPNINPPPVTPANPPVITKTKISKHKIKRRKSVKVEARVSDNIAVAAVLVDVSGTQTLLRRSGKKYVGSFKPQVAGVFVVTLIASDNEGNVSAAGLGLLTVR